MPRDLRQYEGDYENPLRKEEEDSEESDEEDDGY